MRIKNDVKKNERKKNYFTKYERYNIVGYIWLYSSLLKVMRLVKPDDEKTED